MKVIFCELPKQAELALAQSQQRFVSIVESAMDAIIIINSDQHIVLFNSAAEQMFGCSAGEAVGSPIERFIPERFRHVHGQHIRAFERLGINHRRMGKVNVVTGLRADHEEFPLEASISQIEVETDRLHTVILRDITERIRTETLLQKSEAEFRSMFELASVGMVQVDSATGQFLRVNERFCAMTGYSPDELIGKSFTDITHPDDRQCDWAMFNSMVRGEIMKFQSEKRYLHKDGTVVWVNVNAVTIRNAEGRPEYNLAIIEDISARKQSLEELSQAYEQLRESERQNRYLSDLLKQSDQPFGIGFANGKLGYANPAFERLTGYSRDELQALDWTTTLTPPEWRAFEQAKLEELHRSGQPVRYEKEYLHKDGTRVPVELVVGLKTDDDNQPLHYYAFITDLTERKLTEAALLDADRRKDDFLAMLAHELRNPLAPISNAVHILGMLELDEPRVNWVQEIIERQVTHLSRMVDDLLDISRIARGKITLKKERLDLVEVVNQVVKSAYPLIEAKQHHLDIRLPEGLIPVKGDSVRLTQVLFNLIDNAIKYSPEGGKIEIDVQTAGTNVEVQVLDHGASHLSRDI